MLNSKIKTTLKLLISVFVLTIMLALSVVAANHTSYNGVSIVNGKFVGGNSTTLSNSEYAYVTLEDYDFTKNCWSTAIDTSRFTAYNGNENLTENGIVLIRHKSTPDNSAAFYINGKNYVERSEIGEIVESSGYTHVDIERVSGFITGKWTGEGAEPSLSWASSSYYRYNSAYYISETWCYFIDNTTRQNYINTPTSDRYRKKLITEFETASYKYAYQSHEILPIEELLTISYTSGVRQGTLNMSSPSEVPFMTKVVVYILNSSGEIVPYTWTDITCFKKGGVYTDHTLSVQDAFPTATGCVIGVEIYPYGDLPTDTVFSESASVTPICLAFEFKPNGYTTKYKNESMVIPFQYNGANTSYIKGYADGSFRPDEKISKAEVSTIIARLLLSSNIIPTGYLSDFADVTVDAWYHDAVAFLEANGAYSYITENKLEPEVDITRGELAQLLMNASKLIAKETKNSFIDVTDTHKYYDAIMTLSEIGVINGYEDGAFRPDAPVSRAETVTMINRLVNLIVTDKTVNIETLENTFNDIEGHWAELQVLMSANDNVKTKNQLNSTSGLTDNGTTISIETNQVKVTIEKELGRVTEIINKYNGENVIAKTLTPWFATLTTKSNVSFNPRYVEVVDGRLKITFPNGYSAYFNIETFDNYFTVELDSDLPFNIRYIDFGILNINCPFSETDNDSYRLSALGMSTSLNTINRPGGTAKQTKGRVHEAVGNTIGAKVGITFSKYGGQIEGVHRAYLKEIQSAIDPEVGVASTKGGAFTYDIGEAFDHYNDSLFYDYAIISSGLSPSTASDLASLANEFSVEIIDVHRGLFRDADFHFNCAALTGETGFISGKLFKERITDKFNEKNVMLSFHTYSAMINTDATSITSNPKWQKQLATIDEQTLTLTYKMSSTSSSTKMYIDEDYSKMTIPDGQGGYSSVYTGYYLIDEEIVSCQGASARGNGYITVRRGQFGTTPAEHKAGTKAYNLGAYYGGLQPEPGSELFYFIAEQTAKAYNEAGFDMIYLDGFESIGHFIDNPDLKNYYYSEFVRILVNNCEKTPMLESSDNPIGMWTARGKSGAVDHPYRGYKKFNKGHYSSGVSSYRNYHTATLGWFHYAPDMSETYKNMTSKTLFRDDIDLLGIMAIAYNFSTVPNGFTLNAFTNYTQMKENYQYYNIYSRLRKGFYFSDSVKDQLKAALNAGKEYQIFDNNGKWAFREMYYDSNIIRDMNDSLFVTGSATNSFSAQTPYIRIEQRYSALANATEKVLVAQSTHNSAEGYYTPTTTNLTNYRAFKVKVTGNGSATDGILISLKSSASDKASRFDYFIPLNFTGEREFILMDADNGDHDGYSFTGFTTYETTNYETYRNSPSISSIAKIQIAKTGNCTGVVIGDIRGCAVSNAPAENPSITIGSNTMTFYTTLNSGEYIEYLPNENKAYRNYYDGNYHQVEAIDVSETKVTVPAGDYTYTYSATPTANAPLRAKVTIGVQGGIIENEDTWSAPTVVIPKGSIGLGA